jgi:hypothetical protein
LFAIHRTSEKEGCIQITSTHSSHGIDPAKAGTVSTDQKRTTIPFFNKYAYTGLSIMTSTGNEHLLGRKSFNFYNFSEGVDASNIKINQDSNLY